MRLGYFTMPVHPMERDWTETLKEDREAIILCDKLGFYEASLVSKPTGVPVSASGLHSALVSLGLISA